jgi:hypothetical protein
VVVVKEISSPSYSTLEIFKFSNNLKHKKSSIIEILKAFKKFEIFKLENLEIALCFMALARLLLTFRS